MLTCSKILLALTTTLLVLTLVEKEVSAAPLPDPKPCKELMEALSLFDPKATKKPEQTKKPDKKPDKTDKPKKPTNKPDKDKTDKPDKPKKDKKDKEPSSPTQRLVKDFEKFLQMLES